MKNINDIQRYNNLAMEIMGEPEFRTGGFVYKHIKEGKFSKKQQMPTNIFCDDRNENWFIPKNSSVCLREDFGDGYNECKLYQSRSSCEKCMEKDDFLNA